jgi:hypothetical protein
MESKIKIRITYISTKNIKYIGTNLTKYIQDQYNEITSIAKMIENENI